MKKISSKDNQYLKLARSLNHKKSRNASGCFLIEGLRLVQEALSSDLTIKYALIANEADQEVTALGEQITASGIELYQLPTALLEGVSATEHSQGIALVADLPVSIELPPGGHYYALCDSIADPGNLGNIIRSAAAAGVAGLIVNPGCTDIYNPKTVRAAMGGLFHLPIWGVDSNQSAYDWAQQSGLAVYVSAADGQDIRLASDLLTKPHLWVLGSEARGVSGFWQSHATQSLRIPMLHGVESLNVAAAAVVLFYQSFFAE